MFRQPQPRPVRPHETPACPLALVHRTVLFLAPLHHSTRASTVSPYCTAASVPSLGSSWARDIVVRSRLARRGVRPATADVVACLAPGPIRTEPHGVDPPSPFFSSSGCHFFCFVYIHRAFQFRLLQHATAALPRLDTGIQPSSPPPHPPYLPPGAGGGTLCRPWANTTLRSAVIIS